MWIANLKINIRVSSLGDSAHLILILASVFLNLDRDWPVLVEQFYDKSCTRETLRFAIHIRLFLNLKLRRVYS